MLKKRNIYNRLTYKWLKSYCQCKNLETLFCQHHFMDVNCSLIFLTIIVTRWKEFKECSQDELKVSTNDRLTATLGLMPLQTYIDKCKLLLLGRLCRQQTNHITKHIFLWKLGQYLIGINIGKSFVSDSMNVVKKYNLLDVIYSYLQHGNLWINFTGVQW